MTTARTNDVGDDAPESRSYQGFAADALGRFR